MIKEVQTVVDLRNIVFSGKHSGLKILVKFTDDDSDISQRLSQMHSFSYGKAVRRATDAYVSLHFYSPNRPARKCVDFFEDVDTGSYMLFDFDRISGDRCTFSYMGFHDGCYRNYSCIVTKDGELGLFDCLSGKYIEIIDWITACISDLFMLESDAAKEKADDVKWGIVDVISDLQAVGRL